MYPASIRSIGGGALFSALLAWWFTGIAVVGLDEVGLYERFGTLQPTPMASGWHWIWPAPWGRSYRFPKSRVELVRIGATRVDAERERGSSKTLLCGGATEVVQLAAQLTYRPLDTSAGRHARHLCQADPERRLRRLAERYLSRVAVGHSLASLLERDRRQLSAEMTTTLQADCHRADLGLEILEFGIVAVAPPDEVADDFLSVMNASIDADRDLANARIQAQGELTRMAMMSDSAVADAKGAASVRRTAGASDSFALASLANVYRKYPSAVSQRLHMEGWGESLAQGRLVVWDAALPSSVSLTLEDGTQIDELRQFGNEERRP